MTTTELKQVILDFFIENYKRQFIGKLDIQELNPGYKVSIYLDRSEYPLVIISDLEGKDFIKFIKEELRKRKLHKVEHCLATKIPKTNLYTY